MELPLKPTGPQIRSPQLLTLFGQTKVGKTTMLSQLEDCLIIDTEKGTMYITGLKVQVNSLAELKEVMELIRQSKKKYTYIAIDTIDNVVMWVEQAVCAQEGVKSIGDIAYGGGYARVRENMMKLLKQFRNFSKFLIVVGHRKRVQSSEDPNPEFAVNSLDLTGKLKNVVCAESDAIGYVFRNEEGQLMVSFKTSDQIDAGARPEHLKGQVLPFEWSNIYID